MTSAEESYLVAFGARLKEARVAAGWTQTEFARRLDMTRSSVANFEAGRQNPPVSVVARCAEVLPCDPGWLLAGHIETPRPAWPLRVPTGLVVAVTEAEQLHQHLRVLAEQFRTTAGTT